MTTEAFVTLATNDTYSLGALVLANSLRRVGTTRQIAIMITPGVSQGMREQLTSVFDHVTQVNVLDSQDSANLTLLTRPDLGVTFTKLHCWRLTQYTKCVFLDADTLVLQNCDELFEREEFSAAPDPGWPDCFNSGVFVFSPSQDTYSRLLQFAVSVGSFDGGDQGLLNLYFSDWATKDIKKHLPFIYNVVSQTFYSYLPALKQFGKNVKIVHFIGALKPWHASFNTATGHVESQAETYHHQEYLELWWSIFMQKVNPALDPSLTHAPQVGLVGELASLRMENQGIYTKEQLQDRQRQYAWERGHVDYLGMDSFQNIQQHIEDVVSGKVPIEKEGKPEEKKSPAPPKK